MASIETDGAAAAGSCGASRTSALRVSLSPSLVPSRAFVPVPRTVTVRRTA